MALVSDASLVVAIARYRQDALAETYRRHAGAVYALARRLLCDHTLAEEVVQEVFLRIWDAPRSSTPSGARSGRICWRSATAGRST